jgi:hypothetical protein
MRLEVLGKLKKIHLIGTRSHDFPACIIVPQPTTLPRSYVLHPSKTEQTIRKFWEELIGYFPFTIISVSDTTSRKDNKHA